MEDIEVTFLDAQWKEVNERTKVHVFRLASVLAVPLQDICGFLGLPGQDGVNSENWISENQKLKEHFSYASHIWNSTPRVSLGLVKCKSKKNIIFPIVWIFRLQELEGTEPSPKKQSQKALQIHNWKFFLNNQKSQNWKADKTGYFIFFSGQWNYVDKLQKIFDFQSSQSLPLNEGAQVLEHSQGIGTS